MPPAPGGGASLKPPPEAGGGARGLMGPPDNPPLLDRPRPGLESSDLGFILIRIVSPSCASQKHHSRSHQSSDGIL